MAARNPTADEGAEYLAWLRTRADEGDPAFRAMLDARLNPHPAELLAPENEAALAEARVRATTGSPCLTHAEILERIEARRRSEEP